MIYTTVGYNRWPRQWPAEVPLSQRWPLSAPKTAAWPFEWLGRQTVGVGAPSTDWPGQTVLTFLTFNAGTTRWAMNPPLLGPGTVALVAKAITGVFGAPTGIITQLRLGGGDFEDWDTPEIFTPYDLPYEFNRNIQAEPFFMRIGSNKEPSEGFAIYEFFTTRCGREWDVTVPS